MHCAMKKRRVSTTADTVPCGMFSMPTNPSAPHTTNESELNTMMMTFLLSFLVTMGRSSIATVLAKPMTVFATPMISSATVTSAE